MRQFGERDRCQAGVDDGSTIHLPNEYESGARTAGNRDGIGLGPVDLSHALAKESSVRSHSGNHLRSLGMKWSCFSVTPSITVGPRGGSEKCHVGDLVPGGSRGILPTKRGIISYNDGESKAFRVPQGLQVPVESRSARDEMRPRIYYRPSKPMPTPRMGGRAYAGPWALTFPARAL